MLRRLPRLMVLTLFLAAGSSAAADSALSSARANEIEVGSTILETTVATVPLRIPVTTYIGLPEENEGVVLRPRVVADLASFQDRLLALAATVPRPADRCEHDGVDNLVVTLSSAEASLEGERCVVTLRGDASAWICFPFLPRPSEPWITAPFRVVLPLHWEVQNDTVLELRLDDPEVHPEGALGSVAEQVLEFLDLDLGQKAKELLAEALGPSLLRVAVPEELKLLKPELTRAVFAEREGSLAAVFEGKVTLDEGAIATLIAGQE